MDADDAVVDLAATAEPLPPSPNRVAAAFGRARFIDAADRLGVGMFACQQLLALVADGLLIPLDRFQQPL